MTADAGTAEYWDHRYDSIGATKVSWYQAHPAPSVRLIAGLGLDRKAPIVDVGGGASTLVDALIRDGFSDTTVVDISQRALEEAAARVPDSGGVTWVRSDVRDWRPTRSFALWHDRAAYHFLIDPSDQEQYWDTVREQVAPGSYVIVATFAEDGPQMCSGLPVRRYSHDELQAAMGSGFTVVASERESHLTPTGGEQPFNWLVATRTTSALPR
jgi:2-polyprenyl-3-methyl-5-hydroxy-6-metoxy-1,4-benzoquinol methylase